MDFVANDPIAIIVVMSSLNVAMRWKSSPRLVSFGL
jgi:hypothetical protein